jgi:YegS/Rv2252/BmrU family lipid kinase
MKPHLIVNPASANGRTGRRFDRVARAVREALGEFDCTFTRRRGDAVLVARALARDGADLVVAVGGDGTASEVIDGLSGDGGTPRPGPVFGYIPCGTGGDLARTLGYPLEPAAAARVLSGHALRTIDLGRIQFTAHDGSPAVRCFANVAGAGISGLVVRHVERMGKALGGRATFMLGAGRALIGWRDRRVRWRVDGDPWREDPITALCVCNGRFFGGGMMVAPGARVDDGLLDVTLWQGLGFGDFVLRRGMLYDGSHVRLRNTRTFRARVVEVAPLEEEPVLLDVDGEQPGVLPARFEVIPGVLRVHAGAAKVRSG